jgi:hypothetical protein
MGDLRPLGSEKLEGVDKIKRMIEIATYKETPKNNTITESKTNTYSKQLADGYVYGIVLEKSGYIIKKGLNESDLDYVDNIRQRKYYRSYSEAMKKLNLVAAETNRLYENYEGISLLGEQPEGKKKFVLKTKKQATGTAPAEPTAPPAEPATPPAEPTAAPPAAMPTEPGTEGEDMAMPPAEPGMEAPTGPEAEPPAEPGAEGEDMGMPAEPTEPGAEGEDMGMPPAEGEEDMGMEDDLETEGGGESKVSLKAIQKLTGRLSQKVREYEKEKGMDSQDKKYVLNSLISAINVKSLDDDDRDDIFDKLEQYDDYDSGEGDLDLKGGEMEEPMGGEEMPTDTEGGSDELLGGEGSEEGTEDLAAPPMAESVENILSKYFIIKDQEKPILEQKKKKDFLKEKIKMIEIKKEITKLSENIKQRNAALRLFESDNVKFIGKTNKENLVFVKNGKQIKVTQQGRII